MPNAEFCQEPLRNVVGFTELRTDSLII